MKSYLVLTQELDVLRSNVDQCASFLADLREATARPQFVDDFADPSKWSFGDLPKMLSLARSLRPLTQQIENDAASHKRKVAELQSLQLKTEAKREEVTRFIRARSDPEFAKIIRIRQLGPEHVENQNKLRKASQVVRDRIVELDEYLTALKDKLQHAKAGHTALKAPTLDSVARACRNITARTTAVTLDLDNLALEMDLMRPAQDHTSREAGLALSRSASVMSGIDDGEPLNNVGNLMHALPAAATLRSADEITRAERVKSESVAVFVNAREKPILNTRAVPGSQQANKKMAKPMQHSDLQIAFAKGPVHLGKRAPPAVRSASVITASPVPDGAANGATKAVETDQIASVTKSVPVPKLSEPPRTASSTSPVSAAACVESKADPSMFGSRSAPDPSSSASATVPPQKQSEPMTPLMFGGFDSPAAAHAKAPAKAFAGFGSSPVAPPATTAAAAPSISAPKAAPPSQPLSFGGFSQPSVSAPKPATATFGGFGKPLAQKMDSPTAAVPAASSQKIVASSSFSGFSSPAPASSKSTSTPFAGFGSTATPPASAAPPAKSPSTSTRGAAASTSAFGKATLPTLNFGKLSSVPAGMFDLPAKDNTPFQPGARATSSSTSSIRSSHTSKSKFRGTAVQLPPSSSGGERSDAGAGASVKATSDFFALPPPPKAKDGSTADAPSFKGFSGFGVGADKAAPKAGAPLTAAGGISTFNFGDLGKKIGTAAGSSSASENSTFKIADLEKKHESPAAAGDSNKTVAAPPSSATPSWQPAASGFSLGDLGKKNAECAAVPPSSGQPKQTSFAHFSFSDAGKKSEPAKPAAGGFSFGDWSKRADETEGGASAQASEKHVGFSFAPAVSDKPAAEEKAVEDEGKDEKGGNSAKADTAEKSEKPTKDKNEEEEEEEEAESEKTDAKYTKDETLPDPSTFSFCKPSEPRNKEPLVESVSESHTAASTPAARPVATFSFGAASDGAEENQKDGQAVNDKKDDAKSATFSASNGAAAPPMDADVSYPPKAKSCTAAVDDKSTADSTSATSTTTTTSAFKFVPSKLNPSASAASAFSAFKSSPAFGFGALSSPKSTDSSSNTVNAFSFAPQTATPSAKPAFGSTSAFGTTSSFGMTSSPSAASIFGSPSAFGTTSSFGASPSTNSTNDKVKSAFGAGAGFGAFASSNKTSPFASAARSNGEDGDKSGGSLLSRLSGKPEQVASDDDGGEEEEEEVEEEEDDDDADDDGEEEDEDEDYEDEDDYTDEEDYEDEEVGVDVDDDDADSGVGHDEEAGGDSLEESAVHVDKADAQDAEHHDVATREAEDGARNEADESFEPDEDEEEGLSAVEEEPEEEEDPVARNVDKSD